MPTGSVGEHLVIEVHDTGLAATAQGDWEWLGLNESCGTVARGPDPGAAPPVVITPHSTLRRPPAGSCGRPGVAGRHGDRKESLGASPPFPRASARLAASMIEQHLSPNEHPSLARGDRLVLKPIVQFLHD